MGDDSEFSGQYGRLLAKYTHTGCPGMGYEDICDNPAECAADGCCRIVVEQRRKVSSVSEIGEGK